MRPHKEAEVGLKHLAVLISWLAVTGAACSLRDGDRGVQGLPGAPGARGDLGFTGDAGPRGVGQLVYRDANGVYVGPADRWINGVAEYIDPAGLRWPIAVETGLIISNGQPIYYDQLGCTGNRFVSSNVEAQLVFTTTDVSETLEYRALPAGLKARAVSVSSNCSAALQSQLAVPLDDPDLPAPHLTRPDPGFVAPFHLEAQ